VSSGSSWPAAWCTTLTIHTGAVWNQPNIVRGDTGDRLFCSHYVQSMMLWAVPTALEGKDIATFCAPGGLVDRILKAAARPSARTIA
jgi:hypothetical protein